MAVVSFYCDFQDQEKQTAANMIGALTKQLVNAPMKRTFICIDALDECPDKHISQLLTSLHTAS